MKRKKQQPLPRTKQGFLLNAIIVPSTEEQLLDLMLNNNIFFANDIAADMRKQGNRLLIYQGKPHSAITYEAKIAETKSLLQNPNLALIAEQMLTSLGIPSQSLYGKREKCAFLLIPGSVRKLKKPIPYTPGSKRHPRRAEYTAYKKYRAATCFDDVVIR